MGVRNDMEIVSFISVCGIALIGINTSFSDFTTYSDTNTFFHVLGYWGILIALCCQKKKVKSVTYYLEGVECFY